MWQCGKPQQCRTDRRSQSYRAQPSRGARAGTQDAAGRAGKARPAAAASRGRSAEAAAQAYTLNKARAEYNQQDEDEQYEDACDHDGGQESDS